MVNPKLNISILTLNVNGLHTKLRDKDCQTCLLGS